MDGGWKHFWQGVWNGLRLAGIPALVFAAAGFALWVTFGVAKRARDDPLAWAPAQVIVGSTAFLAAILGIVVVFSRLRLQSRSEALGLPSGSIRALIALILIVVFVILGTIIFGALSQGAVVKTYSGLTQEEISGLQGKVLSQVPDVCRYTVIVTAPSGTGGAGSPSGSSQPTVVPIPIPSSAPALSTTSAPPIPAIPLDRPCAKPPAGVITSLVPLYHGSYLADATNEDGKAVGQQIVTALITLMTAISAFYFADKSNERAGRSGDGPALVVLRPSTPFRLPTDQSGNPLPVEIELAGTALKSAGVTATIKSGDETGQVEWTGNGGTFRYTPGQPSNKVTIAFTSKSDPKVSVTVEILAPQPAAAPTPPQTPAAEGAAEA
jgi:hypothetical protein